jgi:putative phosphoesterase
MKIGLLSDTHGYLDSRVFDYFKDCDEIWHAGDIGTLQLAAELAAFKPLKAVYGNIDDQAIQAKYPEDVRLNIEGLSIWMTHIGGVPPTYNPRINKELKQQTPAIFICGHSHICRVKKDPTKSNMLYINPGAAGNHGFHNIKTIIRMELAEGKIKALEVIELGKRGTIKN